MGLLPLMLVLAFSCLSLAQPQGRIVNGSTVDIARHPYCVSLRIRRDQESPYRHECAGVVYSERAVLTAAQCLYKLTQDTPILIVAGANTRTGSDGFVYTISNWTHHPEFNDFTADYDIAVLILETALNLKGPTIRGISPRKERPAAGRLATVAGWGYREEWGPSSYYLEQVHVPIVSTEQCSSIYGESEVTERMICAGDVQQGGIDACQGDAGGPLVIDDQLVGLVSWGRGCARPGYPTVYTYVASLQNWIDETLKANGAL